MSGLNETYYLEREMHVLALGVIGSLEIVKRDSAADDRRLAAVFESADVD